MIQEFKNNNYKIVDFSEKADIYIVNTCTVTNMSDRKSRQILRRTKELNNNAIVVAVGCYAQVGKDNLEKIPEIDLILGTNEKSKILKYIDKYCKEHKKEEAISDVFKEKNFDEFGDVTYTDKTRAVIKIQDGCDRFCTYCIIPYARGRIRSRKKENIINEIQDIVKNNEIKEVVITGIHIASYGKDFKEKIFLIDLLEEINNIDGLERIRLSSLEPKIITKNFVNRLKKIDKICPHFHLSLQSGCDETLKRMNRRYTTSEFEQGVNLLRDTFENVKLTTDIIVGFPGETDLEFNITYKFLQKINFYKMHIFKYSPRTGTKAAIMDNQVRSEIKESRSKELIKLSNMNMFNQNEMYVGKIVKVLFEEIDGEYIKGHTDNYILVKAKNKGNKSNKICNVKIIENNSTELIGEII